MDGLSYALMFHVKNTQTLRSRGSVGWLGGGGRRARWWREGEVVVMVVEGEVVEGGRDDGREVMGWMERSIFG